MESPNPDVFRSPMCSCCPCSISLGPTSLRRLPHKTGTPSSSFFLLGWLGCHSNGPGSSCLRTLQVPRFVSPLWHHHQVFPDWSDCVSTHSKALPPPVSRHLCAIFWQDLLFWGSLFSSSFHRKLVQSSTGMTFLSWSIKLPIWSKHFGGQEHFSGGEYKNTSSPLQCHQTGKCP
jgi:hypothetical protein